MVFNQLTPSFNFKAQTFRTQTFRTQTKKRKFLSFTLSTLLFVVANNNAQAAFVTYNGDSTIESNWQTVSGSTTIEDFESYAVNSQISSLPALGISFETLAGGGLPSIYNHGECCVTPYGSKQLGNFPNGVGGSNQWDDIVLQVLPGYEITALGFWNGDGQSDTLVATAYDAEGNILGSVGSFKGTFAGFISDTPISRIVFDGNTGDGWNHLDGLQTNAIPGVPLPAAFWLLLSGCIGLLNFRRIV